MRIVPLVLVVLLLACAGVSEVEEQGPLPIPVELAPVRIKPVYPVVHGAGRLRAADEVTLSFPSGGVVSRITVEAGDRVERGQLLATLDATASRARLEGARSAAEKAERDFERASALEGTVSRQLREDATTGLEVARATLRAAEFEVRRSGLVAPGDGLVLSRHAEPEQTVAPGAPVLRLATDDAWEMEISVPAAQALRIGPGEPATVRLLAYPDQSFEGIVARRAGGTTTGSWSVWITLDPTEVPLASGLVGGADLAPATPPLPVVPLSALTEVDGSSAAVYTVEDGVARRVPVQIAWLVGDEVALSGATDLQSVITVGTSFVRDGAPVSP
jgi:RND family efflux transporter MFP subunit